MIDKDLAILYGVKTKQLNQAVRRNIKRFPDDFMFQMNDKEMGMWKSKTGFAKPDNLRSQFVTSSYGGRHYHPYVFTEQGIAMLSSVLKKYDSHFKIVFNAIRKLLSEEAKPKNRIGFRLDNK